MTPQKPDPRTSPAHFTAHVPDSFDPTVTRPAWSAYAHWAISTVVVARLARRLSPEEYSPFSSAYAHAHLPKEVRRPLLDDLLGAGVLECDQESHYALGKKGKCLYYRLGPAHRQQRRAER